MTQREKGMRLQALHQAKETFLIANAWDGGSARLLGSLGFPALATSSGACAASFGRRDGQVSREEALAHARVIAAATDLPVSADLEGGYGDSPELVAETIRRAAEAGLVGASIEDFSGHPVNSLYDFNQAVERIQAAAEAARTLGFPFALTARAENFVRGKPDLDDTIRRLQAFEKAGADCLFAPALPDLASVREVCSAVTKPVNFMVTIRGKSFSVAELRDAGVRRISFASSLYRAAMSGLLSAAAEITEQGTFTYLDRILTTPEINAWLR